MRFFGVAFSVVAVFAISVIAGEEQLQQLAAALPSCAVGRGTFPVVLIISSTKTDIVKLECMKLSLPQSSCAITDQKCQCTDVTYTATLERCVVTTCTIRQSLSKVNLQSQGMTLANR
jgi:hypothetical protein